MFLLDALDDAHPLVRSFSAYALGILGEQRALTKLFRILEDKEADGKTCGGASAYAYHPGTFCFFQRSFP